MGDVIQLPITAASRDAYSDLEKVTFEVAVKGMKRIAAETGGSFAQLTLDACDAYQQTMSDLSRFVEPYGDELLVIETGSGTAAVARYSHEAGAFKAPVLILSKIAHERCKEAANTATAAAKSCRKG